MIRVIPRLPGIWLAEVKARRRDALGMGPLIAVVSAGGILPAAGSPGMPWAAVPAITALNLNLVCLMGMSLALAASRRARPERLVEDWTGRVRVTFFGTSYGAPHAVARVIEFGATVFVATSCLMAALLPVIIGAWAFGKGGEQ